MLSTKISSLFQKGYASVFPFPKDTIRFLKLSSTACAVTGGILLAANMPMSKFGFIFLALSSGQLLLASLGGSDRTTTIYAGSLFVFVDCLGIYRWLL